jgi:hypothetical protein
VASGSPAIDEGTAHDDYAKREGDYAKDYNKHGKHLDAVRRPIRQRIRWRKVKKEE